MEKKKRRKKKEKLDSPRWLGEARLWWETAQQRVIEWGSAIDDWEKEGAVED